MVAVPVLVTTIWYVTPAPTPGATGVCTFTTLIPNTSGEATTVKAVTFVSIAVVLHAVLASTYAVFVTTVSTHTSPIVPVIVNVNAVPGMNASPVVDHSYSVPPVTCEIVGADITDGSSVVTNVSSGAILSRTSRLSTVADPTFVTTTWYVTVAPVPGAAGTCVFSTAMLVTGAATSTPTAFVNRSA